MLFDRIGMYPVVIRQSRYSGVYEGGRWFAMLNTDNVPEDAIGDDMDCMVFWSSGIENIIGVGDDPNEAFADLRRKYEDMNYIGDETQAIEKLRAKMGEDKTLPGPGWNHIILRCDRRLTMLDSEYEIFQIKEKFGTLRYYYKTNSKYRAVVEAMARYVDEAETNSMYTCEECGERGTLRKEIGYRKTLCESCYASR
jgi:hypothetical protein